MLMARDGQEAVLHNTGKTYADELDLVSGQVMVEKDSILAGKSLKNGGERQKFCVHGIIGARQTGASNEHEHQTQFS